MSILDLIVKGGIINYILCAGYLLLMVIIVERLIFFWTQRGSFHPMLAQLAPILETENPLSSLDTSPLAPYKKTPYFKLATTYLQTKHLSETQHSNHILLQSSWLLSDME